MRADVRILSPAEAGDMDCRGDYQSPAPVAYTQGAGVFAGVGGSRRTLCFRAGDSLLLREGALREMTYVAEYDLRFLLSFAGKVVIIPPWLSL